MNNDKEFLDWLADRLENVYKENPNTDFIVKLRKIANNYLEDKYLRIIADQLDKLNHEWYKEAVKSLQQALENK